VLEGDKEVLMGDAVQILAVAQKAGAKTIAVASDKRSS
jgi:biopolymer transport protein ExbD